MKNTQNSQFHFDQEPIIKCIPDGFTQENRHFLSLALTSTLVRYSTSLRRLVSLAMWLKAWGCRRSQEAKLSSWRHGHVWAITSKHASVRKWQHDSSKHTRLAPQAFIKLEEKRQRWSKYLVEQNILISGSETLTITCRNQRPSRLHGCPSRTCLVSAGGCSGSAGGSERRLWAGPSTAAGWAGCTAAGHSSACERACSSEPIGTGPEPAGDSRSAGLATVTQTNTDSQTKTQHAKYSCASKSFLVKTEILRH